MATCKDCLHYDVCKSYGVIMNNSLKLKMTEEVESKCPYKLFKSRTIKTNADRTRAMSYEELAEFINRVKEPIEHDPIKDPKGYFIRIVCSECDLHTGKKSNYCPKCGAKMDLESER